MTQIGKFSLCFFFSISTESIEIRLLHMTEESCSFELIKTISNNKSNKRRQIMRDVTNALSAWVYKKLMLQ